MQFTPKKPDLKYPNLGSHLNQLVASVEEGRATAQQAAEGASIHSGESIAVTIHLSANVDDVVRFLEDNGGDPRNVGEDYIEAYVPVALLGAGIGASRRAPGCAKSCLPNPPASRGPAGPSRP